MRDITECIPGAATPMNTLGMGNVVPCVTDPMPTISFKRKKRRKRRMKHLKDIIAEKLKVTTNKSTANVLEVIWDVSDFDDFYRFFGFTEYINFAAYVRANASKHNYKITEYCFGYDVTQEGNYTDGFDGLGNIIKKINTLCPVRFANSKYQDVFGDIDNAGHIDAFLYSNKKLCFVIETFTEGLCFYNIFSLDKQLVNEIIDYLPDDLPSIDAYSLKEQPTIELDFLK